MVNALIVYMNCEPYLWHNAIDGVFLPGNWRGVPTLFSGCSYLALQTKYDVFDEPGYVRILLSIYANKIRRSYTVYGQVFREK